MRHRRSTGTAETAAAQRTSAGELGGGKAGGGDEQGDELAQREPHEHLPPQPPRRRRHCLLLSVRSVRDCEREQTSDAVSVCNYLHLFYVHQLVSVDACGPRRRLMPADLV